MEQTSDAKAYLRYHFRTIFCLAITCHHMSHGAIECSSSTSCPYTPSPLSWGIRCYLIAHPYRSSATSTPAMQSDAIAMCKAVGPVHANVTLSRECSTLGRRSTTWLGSLIAAVTSSGSLPLRSSPSLTLLKLSSVAVYSLITLFRLKST